MMVVYKIMRFVEALWGELHTYSSTLALKQIDIGWHEDHDQGPDHHSLEGQGLAHRSSGQVLQCSTPGQASRCTGDLSRGQPHLVFFQPVHCYFFFRDEVKMRVGVGEDGGEGGEEGDPWELTAPSFTFRRPRAHRLRQTGSDGFGRIGGFLAF